LVAPIQNAIASKKAATKIVIMYFIYCSIDKYSRNIDIKLTPY